MCTFMMNRACSLCNRCVSEVFFFLTGLQVFILYVPLINPFSTNVPLLYPLKTSENRRFSVFSGYRRETLVENGLKNCHSY